MKSSRWSEVAAQMPCQSNASLYKYCDFLIISQFDFKLPNHPPWEFFCDCNPKNVG